MKLEVLDWGGKGRPIVLLADKGFTAHEFDQYAPALTTKYHVYGITRRGYGNSSVPPTTDANYSADRLGDDVLAVLDQLHLAHPVLVGHSIAGEKLSSIGTRAPSKVAGLVYLDAGYAYSLYDAATGDLTIDYNTLRRQLDQFTALAPMKDRKQLLADIAQDLARFEKDLSLFRERLAAAPDSAPAPPDTAETTVDIAIFRGEKKFGGVTCPVLAIYADPHAFGDQFRGKPEALKAAQDKDRSETSAQADASVRLTRKPSWSEFQMQTTSFFNQTPPKSGERSTTSSARSLRVSPGTAVLRESSATASTNPSRLPVKSVIGMFPAWARALASYADSVLRELPLTMRIAGLSASSPNSVRDVGGPAP